MSHYLTIIIAIDARAPVSRETKRCKNRRENKILDGKREKKKGSSKKTTGRERRSSDIYTWPSSKCIIPMGLE